MSARRASERQRPGGFTLVELLVVIGIIIVLIGILLPVLGHVRKSAWATDSQASIMNLASAVERYRQDFNAYPGVFPNTWFDPATGYLSSSLAPGGTTLPPGGKVTMSENLTLALLGGWEPGTTTPSYKGGLVGNGPMTHNPLATARKRYPPYFDATFGKSVQEQTPKTPPTPDSPWDMTVMSDDDGRSTYATADSPTIPEFIDRFPDAMPIIYLRARTGAPSYNATGTLDGTTQYTPDHLMPYVGMDVGNSGRQILTSRSRVGQGNSSFPGYSEPPTRDFATVAAYFRNPGVGQDSNPRTWEVRQKDGFWLIGAGPDRKFGTKDDQTNFGPLK